MHILSLDYVESTHVSTHVFILFVYSLQLPDISQEMQQMQDVQSESLTDKADKVFILKCKGYQI